MKGKPMGAGRFEFRWPQADKVERDRQIHAADEFRRRMENCTQRIMDALLQRLEEAMELLTLGVPVDQITRLRHADGFEEMVPERTDWVR